MLARGIIMRLCRTMNSLKITITLLKYVFHMLYTFCSAAGRWATGNLEMGVSQKKVTLEVGSLVFP